MNRKSKINFYANIGAYAKLTFLLASSHLLNPVMFMVTSIFENYTNLDGQVQQISIDIETDLIHFEKSF